MNNLTVALDSAAAGIEPAIFKRKSNALTNAPPSHKVFNVMRYDNINVFRPVTRHKV